MKNIEYFMWGYQEHFRVVANGLAKRIFEGVDKNLVPEVFLIGLLEDDIQERHPICIESENDSYLVEEFKNIDSVAKNLRSVDKEAVIFQSHPIAQQNQDRRLTIKSYKQAINDILISKSLYQDKSFYVSYPAKVEGYRVFSVLVLNTTVLSNFYSLSKNIFNERFPIRTSFLESLIYQFLNCCTETLYQPDPGTDSMNRSTDEIFRLAAQDFMYTISQAGENYQGLHGLYNACNTISSLKYEGAESIGKMIVAKKSHKNVKMLLELADPIKISDYRKVRKFLEVTDKNSMIMSDAYLIYGLCEKKGKYNPKEESLFEIDFSKHYNWDVSHDGNVLMTVSYMQASIPKERMDRAKFESDIVRLFINIKSKDVEFLWELIESAANQKHGTMLVISGDAKKESLRLGKQSFRLTPVKLDSSFFNSITSIDGAVMLDTLGICHAIGVILDGKATDNGDSSRGARYNSAVRYLDTVKKPTMIIIISEDGMINFIPNLIPQIKHSIIKQSIRDLQALSQSKVDVKKYYKLMDFFKSSAFYLSKEECESINALSEKIKPEVIKITDMVITYPKLQSNKDMNSSYYLPE